MSSIDPPEGVAANIGEVAEACGLYDDPHRASGDVRDIVRSHVRGIDRKIAELAGMRDTLNHLVERCQGDERPECPILDDLASAAGARR